MLGAHEKRGKITLAPSLCVKSDAYLTFLAPFCSR